MEITDSARKHGIADVDILHTVRNALRVVSMGDRDLYIGADGTGRLLEVVVLDDEDRPRSTPCRCVASSTTNSEVMQMPRTPEQLQQAAEDAERWLDSLDPDAISAPEADASDLRRIGRAVVRTARDQAELAESVAAARANGRSWGQIATILGVSRQSARERFGEPAPVVPDQR